MACGNARGCSACRLLSRKASGLSSGAVLALLQRTQTRLSPCLMQHMCHELLKGESLTDQAFERHAFEERPVFRTDAQGSLGCLNRQDDALTHQMRGEIIAFEID